MNHQNQSTTDRRKKQRFPIRRELRYKVMDDRKVIASGIGATLDMGSGGICFMTETELKPGAEIELSVSWPALLNGTCPLRLVTSGKVVRSTGSVAVASVTKFEYRTQGKITQMPQLPTVRRDLVAKPVAAAC